jgi:hypothetical protein
LNSADDLNDFSVRGGMSVGIAVSLQLFHLDPQVGLSASTNFPLSGRARILVTPRVVGVGIDIKPGSWPNSVELRSGGTVPVAIFSSATFDARTVDPMTVTLASAPVGMNGRGTPQASFEDVNGDSLLDLVVHVETSALQLGTDDTVAELVAATFDKRRIRGVDTIRIVPPK